MQTKEYQALFLRKALVDAVEANHIWPVYACCEAALESNWGRSKLATGANNLFGQKQGQKVTLPYPTVDWNTTEVKTGASTLELATWLKFPDWITCFRERMALLRRVRFSLYDPALRAQSGEEFVREVSGYTDEHGTYHSRWATDPLRAEKVLNIHRRHKEFLDSIIPLILPSHPR